MRSEYVILRCLAGREKLACVQLGQQGIHALAPRTRTFEKVSRKRIVATDATLFPGYVFAQVAAWQWPRLKEVPLVGRHPLMSDGQPHRLSIADMAYLQELALCPPPDPRDPRRIRIGDKVAITAGPLQGIHGNVADFIGKHVMVLAHLLGRMTSVRIAPDTLELA